MAIHVLTRYSVFLALFIAGLGLLLAGLANANTEAQERAKAVLEQARQGLVPAHSGLDRASIGKTLEAARGAIASPEISSALNRAYEQSQRMKANPLTEVIQKQTQGQVASVNPAEIADYYRKLEQENPPKDASGLYVFVSTSIPKESLAAIGRMAKKFNATLLIRGVKGGLSGINLKQTLAAFEPAIAQGAEVQIHPEFFKKFDIQAVPTTLLLSESMPDCDQQGICMQHAAFVGDVPIDWVLERFAQRRDVIGTLARTKLAQSQ